MEYHKFISSLFFKSDWVEQLLQDCKREDPEIRAANIGNIVDRIILITGCVALLVVKMTDPNINARASRLRSVLMRCNLRYSLEEIIRTEFHIFKVLGFRIPLWNTANTAEALALEFNLPKHKVQRAPMLADMAEYRKTDIEMKMRSFGYFISKRKRSNNIRSLHLATAAVAAVVAGQDDYCHVLTDLSILIKIPRNYLKCLRDVILTEITFADDDDD